MVSFWEDMQWQCEAGNDFYGGFGGMPFHCQMAILKDLNIGLSDIVWKSSSAKEKESDPAKISDEARRGRNKYDDIGESHLIMSIALSSTTKDTANGENGNEDPDDKCGWDEKGRPSCGEVEASGLDMSVISDDFREASSKAIEFHFFDDDIQLQRTKIKAEYSQAKLMECLKFYGISPTKRRETINNEPYNDDAGFLLYTDLTGKYRGSFEGVRNSDKAVVRIFIDGYSMSLKSRDAVGLAPGTWSGTVYIDNEIEKDEYVFALATAIHEIGNGLAKNLKDPDIPYAPKATNPILREFDSDSGMFLEECVFGGYVGRDGYVRKAVRIRGRRR